MTGMLASVGNLQEAKMIFQEQADIIDLKNPADGALGRLPTLEIRTIVDFIGGRCPVSATIGDLPMDGQLISDAVQEIAETKVNFVKIGLMANGSEQKVIQKLSASATATRLIAVLFADQKPDFNIIGHLKNVGFNGVMLDTFDKSKGSLTKVMDHASLSRFVNLARENHLICGLAGSLALTDITGLLTISPDYLGFRGALCRQSNRINAIDIAQVRAIKRLMASG